MPDPADLPLDQRLQRLKIIELDEQIFSMSKERLLDVFKRPNAGLNDTRLLKSLIWQDYTKITSGALAPIHGNIRSYWYDRAKPVFSRVGATKINRLYNVMIREFAVMVLSYRLFNYRDWGFSAQRASSRQLGTTDLRHIFLVAEKFGQFQFLQDMAWAYGVTIIALGGQPSALNTEYFLRDLSQAGLDLSRDTPLLTVVDFDPSGSFIAESFIYQLKRMGYTGQLNRVDLVHPSRMTTKQIRENRFKLPTSKGQRKKLVRWLAWTNGGLQPYGFGRSFGIEADSMSHTQLTSAFLEALSAHIDQPIDQLHRRQLTRNLVFVLTKIFNKREGLGQT